MPSGKKRILTYEERIRFEEEERYLKASRGILEERLVSVQEELESARIQERQLRDQIDTIGGQLKSQKESRARQVALQLELNKSLSKTRVSFMKVVTESVAAGNLSQMEGLTFIIDETIKEILTLDDLDRPHANHRCQAMQNTCLDISAFFPSSSEGVNERGEQSDPIFSTCSAYLSHGRCDNEDCRHHQTGQPRVPPQLDPLPDPFLPDTADVDEGEISRRGNILTAWWLNDSGRATLSCDDCPLSIGSVLQAVGVRAVGEKLLLEHASSENVSATPNVARYVDGFSLALHAGTISGPFDLAYLATALEDLSFPPDIIKRVKNVFGVAANFNCGSLADTCRANFEMQVEFFKATMALEGKGSLDLNDMGNDESSLDTIVNEWEARKRELSVIDSLLTRRVRTLAFIVPVGRAVLQELGKAAEAIGHSEFHGLAKLQDRIDRALISLLNLAIEDTFSQLLLAPLLAGNIALACTLKMYHKAQSRLEWVLNFGQDEASLNLLVFSELLWSQLVQLRMCLPPSGTDSAQMATYKILLDGCVNDLGVKLRHVKPVVGRVK